jgi:hypothetical protein
VVNRLADKERYEESGSGAAEDAGNAYCELEFIRTEVPREFL